MISLLPHKRVYLNSFSSILCLCVPPLAFYFSPTYAWRGSSPQECRDNATTFCPFVCDHQSLFRKLSWGRLGCIPLSRYPFTCMHPLTCQTINSQRPNLKGWFDVMNSYATYVIYMYKKTYICPTVYFLSSSRLRWCFFAYRGKKAVAEYLSPLHIYPVPLLVFG